jgi:hypothetical protein
MRSTGVSRCWSLLRMKRTSSRPLMFGMFTSVMTRSYGPRGSRRSASKPLAASTTSDVAEPPALRLQGAPHEGAHPDGILDQQDAHHRGHPSSGDGQEHGSPAERSGSGPHGVAASGPTVDGARGVKTAPAAGCRGGGVCPPTRGLGRRPVSWSIFGGSGPGADR